MGTVPDIDSAVLHWGKHGDIAFPSESTATEDRTSVLDHIGSLSRPHPFATLIKLTRLINGSKAFPGLKISLCLLTEPLGESGGAFFISYTSWTTILVVDSPAWERYSTRAGCFPSIDVVTSWKAWMWDSAHQISISAIPSAGRGLSFSLTAQCILNKNAIPRGAPLVLCLHYLHRISHGLLGSWGECLMYTPQISIYLMIAIFQ